MLKRITIYYKNHGLLNLSKKFISKFIVLLGLVEDVPQARIRISNKIYDMCKGIVKYGPLKGLKLDINDMNWSQADLGSILLGIYEKEVLDELEIISKDKSIFCDIGAADGIYGVGLLVNELFDKSICFEIDKKGQNNIKNLSNKNNLAHRVKILDEASVSSMQSMKDIDWNDACILIDIEGEEFNFINSDLLEVVCRSNLIIEIHDNYMQHPEKSKKDLENILETKFSIKKIKTKSRDLSNISEVEYFHDNDRWLLCSEGRGWLMEWWICKPLTDLS